jgi:hypothetical protein
MTPTNGMTSASQAAGRKPKGAMTMKMHTSPIVQRLTIAALLGTLPKIAESRGTRVAASGKMVDAGPVAPRKARVD